MTKPEISPENLELANRIMEIMEGKEYPIERLGIYQLAEGLIQYYLAMRMLADALIKEPKINTKKGSVQ
jgi:hypothetical protein